MMVTFISECEKKALKRTRRVLDAFANRIGSRSWQTVITEEGLQAVKKLLRKSATKNSAVACHWIRSRSRSELLWVVGNRSRFDHEGIVPVNSTQKPIEYIDNENSWQYLPLIKALTALAALFHDWGKASAFFQFKLRQKKIIGDPYRHEWISLLFISVLTSEKTDDEWLGQLSRGVTDLSSLTSEVNAKLKKPFKNLSVSAQMIAWLVVSHHRLPVLERIDRPVEWTKMLNRITTEWGYENRFDEFEEQLKKCFEFPNGQAGNSRLWLKEVRKWARKLQEALPLMKQTIDEGSWRAIMQHCRLCLMLGDHYYSSLEPSSPNRLKNRELNIYANTDKHHKLKQTLDEHLLGVARQAIRIAHFLPVFEGRPFQGESMFKSANDIRSLEKNTGNSNFKWQDKASRSIVKWRESQPRISPTHFGFFAVNMASTGKGKTFANAKIMRALSADKRSLRYVLALGLRTLTLQTGDEYRNRIGLDKDELAVLIGSKAVQELYEQSGKTEQPEHDNSGSESVESLLENELDFEFIPELEEMLKTVLTRSKDRQFLYAPVLACTIDHIISATDTRRGGKYILPTLRLMYSDLVIDEVDDFDGTDLVSIGRLIHLSGMLGRKVMISSATITPDIAEGYFNAYSSGWQIFAKMRGKPQSIGCAWIDEFNTTVANILSAAESEQVEQYRKQHETFIKKRLKKLDVQPVKHKAAIVGLSPDKRAEQEDIEQYFFRSIRQTVIQQHRVHSTRDEKTGKQISFGVVRVANISTCIELTKYLLDTEWPASTAIRIMAYHSQQVLLMRHEQEKHLDTVLKRKHGKQASFDIPLIRQHIEKNEARQIIFIVVATPVEEVGRDHDFDWAIIEPSSYRSIIQMAGRVLRHQVLSSDIVEPNIQLLQFNLKGLSGRKISFNRPGYESNRQRLESHDLTELIAPDKISKRLDVSPRLQRPDILQPSKLLADLEHEAIHQLLTHYSQNGANSLQGWLNEYWWLTGNPQALIRLRSGNQQKLLYLLPQDTGLVFCEKQDDGQMLPSERIYGIQHDHSLTPRQAARLWITRDYMELLQRTNKPDEYTAALVFGEINLPLYNDENTAEFIYSSQLGLMRKGRK
jgi:CRISPR-associated endonuclease/helicase Cas3